MLHTSTDKLNQSKTRYTPCYIFGFISVSGFEDGSDTPKTYKDVTGHKNQARWW
jgi:hypothetical protein